VEHLAGSAGFLALRDLVLELARLASGERVLDVGAGTGLLTVSAAPHVAHIAAVDVSPAMCRHLKQELDRHAIDNAVVLHGTATDLPLDDAAVDVVVSNYCFHHLHDADKRRALAEIRRVLRPGGRLVFADVMFRLSVVSSRDRAVIVLLVRRIAARGPAGLLRLLKNATRIAARRWEYPATVEWWRAALTDAGFEDVMVRALEHEGGIASARTP
jgi:ubiquinone/menaquinone biosynthesis C-methylase UbiE